MEVREPSAKYLAKAAFKQTEAGLIPDDWGVSTIGEEFSIRLGKMLDAEKNVGDPKPFLGNRAVQWGRIDASDLGLIKLTPSDLQRYRLREGDLLVCEGGEVGRSAIWRAQLDECYYQKALHRLRAKRGFNVLLLQNLLQRFADSGVLQNYVTQTSIAHLPKDKFETIPIPVPASEEEQQAIATALSDADSLIESLEQLLAKKRQIKQGAMQELLTAKRRLPGFEGEWRAGLLSDVLDSLIAGVSVNSDDGAPTDGVPCVLKTSALSNGKLFDGERKAIVRADWSRAQTTLQANTILISRMNTPDLVGEVAYVAEDRPSLFLPDRIWMTKFRSGVEIDVRWLAYLLCSTEYKRKIKDLATGTSGSMKNISKGALFELPVSFPVAAEQTAIATILSDMDADIATLEAKLAKARAIKQGMMQELLTGRIRLV